MIDIKIQPMELPELALNGVVVNHGETKDYEKLENKPKLNSVELIGDRQLSEVGIDRITNAEIFNLLEGTNL